MQEFNINTLKKLVESTGKRLNTISNEIGVHQTMLSNWLSGRNVPSKRNVVKLADYFGVDTKFLFQEHENIETIAPVFNYKNLKILIDESTKTKNLFELSLEMGVSDRQLKRWYDGESRPHNGNIDKICTYFNIDRSALFQDSPPDLPLLPAPVPTPGGIHIVTVDTQNNPVIKLVPMAAQAGYLTEATDPDYWEELPEISISHHRYQGREMRAFEVAGDSMEPAILHSDWLFCARLEKPEWIQPGQVYIVVTPYALVVKRLHYQRGSQYLTCISDNAAYPEYEIATADIRELWQCLGLHRWQIPGKGMGK